MLKKYLLLLPFNERVDDGPTHCTKQFLSISSSVTSLGGMMFPKDQSSTLKEVSLCPEETKQDRGGRAPEQEEVWLTGAREEWGRVQGQAVIVSARPAERERPIAREVPALVSAVPNAVPQWFVLSPVKRDREGQKGFSRYLLNMFCHGSGCAGGVRRHQWVVR
ncbi:MAG: hypothetical protein JW836_09640 [Deltaproteobacteria bacterium]|nr:hypothetical protein [Deltaproteobacteria bacterium]